MELKPLTAIANAASIEGTRNRTDISLWDPSDTGRMDVTLACGTGRQIPRISLTATGDSHGLCVHCDHDSSDYCFVVANTAQRWGRGLDLSYPKHLRVLR